MSKRTQVLAALAVFLAGVWIYEARSPRGPSFQGRDISYWFNDSRWRDGPGLEAFRSMGSNAVPYLVAQVQREDSALVGAWRRRWQQLPVWLKRRISAPLRPGMRQQHALALLEVIGQPAQAGVPGLITAYNHSFLRIHQLSPDRPVDWVAEFQHPALVFSGGAIPPPTTTNRYGVLIPGSPLSRPENLLCFSELVSLARIGGANPQIVPLLLAAIRDPSLHAEYLMLSAGSSGGGGLAPAARLSEPILLAALGDTNQHVSTAAATLLGALTPDHPEVIPPLLQVLEHGHPEDYDPPRWPTPRFGGADPSAAVYVAVMTSLAGAGFEPEKIATKLCGWLTSARSEVRPQAINALARIGQNSPEARRVLLRALESTNRAVWVGAAQVLGRIRFAGYATPFALAEPARDPLDPETFLRDRIVEAFGKLDSQGNDEVWARMEQLLLSDDGAARLDAATALGELGTSAQFAVPALVLALKDADSRLRAQAAVALGEIGPVASESVPALKQALGDWDLNVRDAARAALERIAMAGGKP